MRYLLTDRVEVEDAEGYRCRLHPGFIPYQYVVQVRRCYGPATKLIEEVPEEE